MRRTLCSAFVLLAVSACSSSSDGTSSSSSSGGTDAGSTTGTPVACSFASTFKCSAQSFGGTAAVQSAKDKCTADGGSALDACPSTNLLGCCTLGNVKSCVYSGGTVTAASGEKDCSTARGVWSTTP